MGHTSGAQLWAVCMSASLRPLLIHTWLPPKPYQSGQATYRLHIAVARTGNAHNLLHDVVKESA